MLIPEMTFTVRATRVDSDFHSRLTLTFRAPTSHGVLGSVTLRQYKILGRVSYRVPSFTLTRLYSLRHMPSCPLTKRT